MVDLQQYRSAIGLFNVKGPIAPGGNAPPLEQPWMATWMETWLDNSGQRKYCYASMLFCVVLLLQVVSPSQDALQILLSGDVELNPGPAKK